MVRLQDGILPNLVAPVQTSSNKALAISIRPLPVVTEGRLEFGLLGVIAFARIKVLLLMVIRRHGVMGCG